MNKENKQTLQLALYEPRIPQNSGNIARTSAAFKLPLHLIEPLGYSLDSKYLKRAGLDYWPYINIKTHPDYNSFLGYLNSKNRIVGFSKSAENSLNTFEFLHGDVLLFGREDIGLPNHVRQSCHKIVSIPMPGIVNINGVEGVRSLNLSSAASIVVYQASLKLGLV